MKKIYIAGPITGREKEAEIQFKQTADQLRDAYPNTTIINPMALDHNHDKEWASYMSVCIKELITCDTIYLLPDWLNSAGTIIEVLIAWRMGITTIDSINGEVTKLNLRMYPEYEVSPSAMGFLNQYCCLT